MTKSIEGAQIRVDRARKHLEELRELVSRFGQSQIERVSYDLDPATKQLSVEVAPMDLPPQQVGAIVGDVVNNLRSALDYLIYELAMFNTGTEVDGTQFPIEDTEKVFTKRRVPTYLRGLNTAQIAAVKELQPFRGCDWTKRLRDLSNPDKHRHVTPLDNEAESLVTISAGKPGSFADRVDGTVYKTTDPDGLPMDMHVNLNIARLITLSDGTTVLETLEQLCGRVTGTLEAFDPEFE